MKSPLQFIYSLIIIILIPTAIAANTLFLLHTFHSDTDFELNNKALLLASTIALQARDKFSSSSLLQTDLTQLITQLPEIKAIAIFDSQLQLLISTSPKTSTFSDSVLNQLALNTSQAYSKQILAAFVLNSPERVWLVATPVTSSSGQKLGLINLYLSAEAIDSVTNRTAQDSLWILGGTILIVILLLINHFRFFETALLFKKLSEVDQLKDDFISVASHELKTPLTAIIGYASLLAKEETIRANSSLLQKVDIITSSVDRLKNLVSDMLDVSRIEQNRITLNPTTCDLRDLITKVVADQTPQATAKQLKLTYTPGDLPLIVSLDPDKFTQVLLNLVSNAIKYTLTGEVTIYHLVKDKSVVTYIKDTGIGISAANRAKLFTKFTRIYNDQTATVPGTGLGLWITKQLVEKMGGQISVDSIENSGSQFSLTFPLKNP